jgi:hypothetical protein
MIRALVAAIALVFPAVAHASSDAHDAVAAGTFDLRASEVSQVAFAGTGGLGWARAAGGGLAFATYAFEGSAVEAGVARSIAEVGSWRTFAAISGLVVPRGGLTAGARGLLAFGATFGERLLFAPAVSASFAVVGGPGTPVAVLAPLEASLALGWRFAAVRPFVRVSGGVDVLAAERLIGRGTLALGVAFGP